jgi:hypothetical protein
MKNKEMDKIVLAYPRECPSAPPDCNPPEKSEVLRTRKSRSPTRVHVALSAAWSLPTPLPLQYLCSLSANGPFFNINYTEKGFPSSPVVDSPSDLSILSPVFLVSPSGYQSPLEFSLTLLEGEDKVCSSTLINLPNSFLIASNALVFQS